MFVILVLLSLGVIVTLFSAAKYKKALSKNVVLYLFALLLPTVATYCILLSKNRLVTIIAYHLYGIGMVAIHYLLLTFVYSYWGEPFLKTKLHKLFLGLAIIDGASLCANLVFHHVFSIFFVPWRAITYQIQPNICFWYHVALELLFLLCAIRFYAQKLMVSSRLYTERFILLFAGLILVALFELYFVIMQGAADYSVLAHLSYGILAVYSIIAQHKFQISNRMLSRVVARISDAVVFLDVSGECIYMNDSAAKLLNILPTELHLVKSRLVHFFELEDQWSTEHFKQTKEFTRDYQEFSYETEFHRVYDNNGVYSGAFVRIRDRTEDARRLHRETFAAHHDGLTGLYNRDYLCRRIEEMLRKEIETEYLIICSDVLEFKLVNDIFGKEVGDQILINMARILDEYGRRHENCLYGRIGGDRFAVLCPKEIFNEKRFVEGAGDFSFINGEIFYPATIQFGVYEVTERELPASIMFDRAFMAIDSIKNDLQKRIAYYTNEMRDILLWEQQLTTQLDSAMRENLIMPYLQPQVDTEGRVEGAEVLCRWDHTPQGIMVPENFIGILERNGMIVRLDYFMWESACRILQDWKKRGKESYYLSVNISPKDFYFIDVYETITSLVEKYNIEPERLRLEITETVMMTDSGLKFQIIDKLRDRGFVVEMDDFGSGYSSLNMLKDLPIDIIKFDMLFLAETVHKERARTILRYMFEMANQLEIPVITEGVETQEQADFLAGLGCNMFQGFFFSRPITLEAFEKTYF